MFNFITGTVEVFLQDGIILNNNGIGYKVFLSEIAMKKLPSLELNSENKEVRIFVHMSVKEDGITLFGFLSAEELDIFEKLITVSGVGPKSSLSLLSRASPKDIITAIITGDEKTLSLGKGIGKKMVQRIILELRDKVDIKSTIGLSNEEFDNIDENEDVKDAIDALVALGFSNGEVITAVNSVVNLEENLSTNKIINLCLKKLSSR